MRIRVASLNETDSRCSREPFTDEAQNSAPLRRSDSYGMGSMQQPILAHFSALFLPHHVLLLFREFRRYANRRPAGLNRQRRQTRT